jgi:SagB-type dehydrogenase family enzyme
MEIIMSPEEGIGGRYLTQTRYRRDGLKEQAAYPRAPLYKEYPGAVRRVALKPQPDRISGELRDCLKRRRSLRQYQDRLLSLDELTALLWAAQGITLAGRNYQLRTAPSAGALYPVETYVAVHRVEGLEPGIWHLQASAFELELIREGDMRKALMDAGLFQSFLGTAAAVFIWTAVLNRARWKYRERAIRYLFLDAGHICQNLMLAATALGLGTCPVGAFFDGEVEALLGVEGDEEPALYLASVGAL